MAVRRLARRVPLTEIECAYCRKPIEKPRVNQAFCRTICRVEHWRKATRYVRPARRRTLQASVEASRKGAEAKAHMKEQRG